MSGLKWLRPLAGLPESQSHRSRGAWIEICPSPPSVSLLRMSHRSRGAWIEIWASLCLPSLAVSRIAHAVRGLKSQLYLNALTKFTRRIAHAVRGLKFIIKRVSG